MTKPATWEHCSLATDTLPYRNIRDSRIICTTGQGGRAIIGTDNIDLLQVQIRNRGTTLEVFLNKGLAIINRILLAIVITSQTACEASSEIDITAGDCGLTCSHPNQSLEQSCQPYFLHGVYQNQ